MAVRSAMLNTNVCMPARVHAVHADQTVDLQLLPQTLYATASSPRDKEIVLSAPVAMPVGKAWSVRYPLAVGDLGLAIFADRSLDGYSEGDGSQTYDPADTRMHALGDAIFLPGLPTTSTQTQDGTTDLVFTNGQSQVRMQPGGTVQIKNGAQELVALVSQLMGQVSALCDVLATKALTNTMLGPQPFLAVTVAALQNVQAAVQQLNDNLDTLKGG